MSKAYGVTMGDPAGIGAEIIVKAFAAGLAEAEALPVVIGSGWALQRANSICGTGLEIRSVASPDEAVKESGCLCLIDTGLPEPDSWEYGKAGAGGGAAAYSYIERAIELAVSGELSAVVTAPICKESLHMAGYRDAGHTEIFADLTGTREYAMLLTVGALRVSHVTTHVSMGEACGLITKQRVLSVTELTAEALKGMGIRRPKIAVAGLNPHCSEDGLFGHEEAREILPAVQSAQARGIDAVGPLPADTVFVKALAGQFDGVVAMYHDQGHIPVKLAGFKADPETGEFTSVAGVNVTLGLPVIRTSVDHGTAFDIAGTGAAKCDSLMQAAALAVKMAQIKEAERIG